MAQQVRAVAARMRAPGSDPQRPPLKLGSGVIPDWRLGTAQRQEGH